MIGTACSVASSECRHRSRREPFPPGSPVPRDPPRTGSSHGPQARSRVAAGDERSELALDGAEDRATSTVAGGARVAGGGRGPAPVAPVVSVGSDTGGDIRVDIETQCYSVDPQQLYAAPTSQKAIIRSASASHLRSEARHPRAVIVRHDL